MKGNFNAEVAEAQRKAWESMKPKDRDWFIGELLVEKPQTQLYFSVDGKFAGYVAGGREEDMSAHQAVLEDRQKSNIEWEKCQRRDPELYRDAWRGKIEIKCQRWHINYSSTPGGAWRVVEAIRAAGWTILISGGDLLLAGGTPGWDVVIQKSGQHVRRKAETMEEAICLAGITVLAPDSQRSTLNFPRQHK